jgi:phage shock protein PspC (stress-responsive transcriptional regulator)
MMMIPMSDPMSEDFALKKVRIGAKPFVRPLDDRIIFGVCSGIARKVGVNPLTSRILFSLFTIFSGVVPGALFYLIIFLLYPQE